ncbi:WG repeat-containing protein [Flavobacterium piscis]|uniref:WG repeat-containing protein n=1 Tax=Flavobacterium piscis TaxID=1114874 RepID=A0ABU1Y3N6_9FLAO|nr:WG repeat-containing protein [Flavobacterium piscis]MDR7208141.1 hypothetical protein [Flavobacterium piscis]
MKQITFLYLFLIILNCSVFAQNKDTWISFWDKDTTHVGFKDKTGTIKIEPKFMGLTSANKFDDIIAVTEEDGESWESYYLTKNGKRVGIDSLYTFDNGPDCENEGLIRFRDPKTDKMGMFNGQGKIVIPAEYNNLTKARNGMVIVLQGAEKIKDNHEGCNHFSWTGGKEYLIDINNKTLVKNFAYNDDLNFYSVEKSAAPSKDPTRENFLGIDGQYYSFINFNKEFEFWLQNNLLTDLSKNNLLKSSFDNFTYWKEPNGWVSESKTKFIDKNYNFIKLKLKELTSAKTEYFVSSNGLNPFIFDKSEYEIYFNNCNEAKEWMYPVRNIIISPKNKSDFGQDHFEFLRTESGYKLISISDRKNNLK